MLAQIYKHKVPKWHKNKGNMRYITTQRGNKLILMRHKNVPYVANMAPEQLFQMNIAEFFIKFLTYCFNMFFISTTQVRRVWKFLLNIMKDIYKNNHTDEFFIKNNLKY